MHEEHVLASGGMDKAKETENACLKTKAQISTWTTIWGTNCIHINNTTGIDYVEHAWYCTKWRMETNCQEFLIQP